MCGILLVTGESADSPGSIGRANAALNAMAARGPTPAAFILDHATLRATCG